MIEPYIRPFYQEKFGDPLARGLGKVFTPNTVTLISILLGVGIVPALYMGETYLALGLLLLTGACDTLDGTIARLYGKSSPFGAVWDIVGDRLVEFSILFGLFLVSPETRAFDTILMLGSVLICVTSFLVVGIFTENDSNRGFHYSPGLMERPEAFLFFAAMISFSPLFHVLSLVFTFLVFLTALIRIIEFRKHTFLQEK